MAPGRVRKKNFGKRQARDRGLRTPRSLCSGAQQQRRLRRCVMEPCSRGTRAGVRRGGGIRTDPRPPQGSLAWTGWGWGCAGTLTSQVPKPGKPILVHSSAPRDCQASLWSFPRCLGNELPTRVAHSKVEEPERTMPDCSKPSSVPLEAFYGPSLGKHGPH